MNRWKHYNTYAVVFLRHLSQIRYLILPHANLFLVFNGSIIEQRWNFALHLMEIKLLTKMLTKDSRKRVHPNRVLPILASRLTQLGIGFPVSLMQASLQKWLQFLVIKLYAFPLYSPASSSSMTALTSPGPISVFPIKIVFLNVNPSHCFGSPSKIPVDGYSWAPNAYSTPWTERYTKQCSKWFKKYKRNFSCFVGFRRNF